MQHVTEIGNLHDTISQHHAERKKKSLWRGVAGTNDDPISHLRADVDAVSSSSRRSPRTAYRHHVPNIPPAQIDKKVQEHLEQIPHPNKESFDPAEMMLWLLRIHKMLKRLEERKRTDKVAEQIWTTIGDAIQLKVPQLISERTYKIRNHGGPWPLMQVVYDSLPTSKTARHKDATR